MTLQQFTEQFGSMQGRLTYGNFPEIPTHKVYDMQVVTTDDGKDVMTVPNEIRVMWCHNASGRLLRDRQHFEEIGFGEDEDCAWEDLEPVLVIGGC